MHICGESRTYMGSGDPNADIVPRWRGGSVRGGRGREGRGARQPVRYWRWSRTRRAPGGSGDQDIENVLVEDGVSGENEQLRRRWRSWAGAGEDDS